MQEGFKSMTVVYCAWCQQEDGIEPQEEESHGICEQHAELLLLDLHWRRLQSVPSYVEGQAAKFVCEY